MKRVITKSLLVLMSAALLLGCKPSEGEKGDTAKYPEKNVEVIVAYKAGGGTDRGARILMKESASEFEKPLVIVNRPGADGQLGFTELSRAKPDGYTIGFINLPNYVSISLTRKTQFDKDTIIPIINYVYDQGVFVVRADSKWNTLEEFVAEAKERPDQITVSNNGTGASNHIGAAQFASDAEIELKHIPFGGSSDMLAALRGAHVDATVAKISEVSSLVKSGELRILASFTEDRLDGLDEVPTLKEKGYDVIFGSARGLAAPAGTPQEIVDILHDKFKGVMESPEHIKAAKDANMPIHYMGQSEYREFIDKQEADLKVALKLLGLN